MSVPFLLAKWFAIASDINILLYIIHTVVVDFILSTSSSSPPFSSSPLVECRLCSSFVCVSNCRFFHLSGMDRR